MPALKIPKEFESAMAEIIGAEDSAFGELMSALETAPLVFRYQELAKVITPKVSAISPDLIQSIVPTFTSLYSVGSSAGVPIERLVNDLIEGMQESDLKEVLETSGVDKVKQRLTSLLSNRAILFTSKANEIQKNYGKAFCMAEMLTDIRPVFINEGEPPMAAICSNILKVTYHEREELKDIFFALTPRDLESLEDLIDQARTESKQLQSILDKAGVAHPNDDKELDNHDV